MHEASWIYWKRIRRSFLKPHPGRFCDYGRTHERFGLDGSHGKDAAEIAPTQRELLQAVLESIEQPIVVCDALGNTDFLQSRRPRSFMDTIRNRPSDRMAAAIQPLSSRRP